MASEKQKAVYGEMRRRHEAIVRSGVLSTVRSEGRLVFVIALVWADYKTCKFVLSCRGAATIAGVQINSIRRGIKQLEQVGVIERGPKTKRGRDQFKFVIPTLGGAHTECQGAHTGGVRGAHSPCQGRTPGVSGAHTGGDPYSSIVLKDSSKNP
jgi:hypothetical protein